MKRPHLLFRRRAAGAAALGLLAFVVAELCGNVAQTQTAKAIKIIVPYPAGGNTDALARLLAEQISRTHGTTMLIENRPGAGTDIGTDVASRAAPDGNTLLIVGAAFAVRPHLRKLNYDPLARFAPVCHLTSTPYVIAVHSASPYRTLADLMSGARAKPGELTLAGVGPGSNVDIAFVKLKRAAGVDMTFVPYAGNAPAVNALLGEHALSQARFDALPDVPTLVESGYQGVDFELPNWLFVPAKTPNETISKLAGWFTAALQAPEVRPRLIAQGLYPVGTCGPDFTAEVRKQIEDYGRVIHDANIKAE